MNMLFKGTHVVSGGGRAVVVATGEHTVIGRIATTLSSITSEVPLKKDIRALSHVVIVVTLLISLSLFVAGVVLGKSAIEMFMIAVSLTVSVIPEGLPIVVTLILATGAWRMLRRNALVKRLQAVEALGQAKVIAVDKTGTITKNELTVQRVYVDGRTYEVGGSGYDPAGDIRLEGETVEPLNHADLVYAGKVSAFCASGHASFDSETNRWRVSGDPTEAALSVFAEKVGFRRDELNHESPKVAEVLFNSGTRYHAVVHMVDEKPFLAVAGAPEVILDLSSQVWSEGGPHKLTEAKRRELEKVFTSMTEGGMRVIALAAREDAEHTIEDGSVQDLTFVHFVGMIDALRVEAQEAIEQARAAGIRVVMITGDHVLTAKAIASTAGIYREGDKALTGADIEALSADELREQLAEVTVFARVTPEHKLHIIEGYKARGEVVAMTGDGVNDAPSLVAADLGVAMGAIGTEVAKEASDIVLLDDNMSTIVAAIEEGRNIYRTIKKVILYLFSTSLGEILTITVALAIGYPLPLLAAQIIWLNFVTDGFLTVALAMEPKEDDLLRRSFSKAQRALIDGTMVVRMFTMAIPMAIGSLILFGEYVDEGDITRAMTIALTTLAAFQWFNAWNVRHATHSVFTMNPFSNRYLLGATAIVILLQLAAVYTPFLQHVLRTSPLSLSDWLWIIPVAASIILVEEVRKLIVRILEARRARRKRIIEALPEAAETAPAQ
ncbi:ATPase [Candidatus Kaiserbacteria bacterium CG10_big_fil_rev_8_21_14_0_10_59_10]|uniref:ATPase n=1 Tax=Candidatus Kaiserbacteria bacterium CG10_big_fil_rev_8_21_14_0_10_59_10 TaxID=1974612 RepID=A0A2H0U7C6_9BACT|nr:MAG: ATPase [Candidatus Kaiserbacteria bacterium CG10_big_fil_rev_8_21_14_0_10_59_10]